ncbi:uncharacterized protein Z518_06719 [Rhinocladiella mackenziei CBS 650.93]|uniref:Uncharacterized protein n=1 Tax=Rhinocladiella mackenziei CBS 650.93 TaxID=1442369 RepID=A0A0D2GY77_9EURO|nr:uncharacterized protein Z518_06719 [Rhinocladiella mackenziei CBS 650.93]KIX03168.1 hypothetical protein Z518_06719 [Rhinocladiella mackenziei CBS 650.93]
MARQPSRSTIPSKRPATSPTEAPTRPGRPPPLAPRALSPLLHPYPSTIPPRRPATPPTEAPTRPGRPPLLQSHPSTIPFKRRATPPTEAPTRPGRPPPPSILPPLAQRALSPPPPPSTPVRRRPEPPASCFLLAEQWASIQSFHAAMDHVKMETCSRCHARWFSMDVKNDICHACFLRDQGGKTPFLMSAENAMDPGERPAHLPALTQIEEMIVARSHVQMMVYRYRGHQYHYSGHFPVGFSGSKGTCHDLAAVSPGPPPGLPVCHHSPDRIDALPIDDDISSSFLALIDDTGMEEEPPAPEQPVSAELLPPDSQSMVPNLNITTTEVDLIVREIASRNSPPAGLPAPSIRQTPIDEASGKDRIFAMAFPTLYPTGQADFNTPRIRKVSLTDYARHPTCFHDGRFGRHPRWRFFVFNLLMRRKANGAARFYVSEASGPKDLSREELTEALLVRDALLPQIVPKGSDLTGTRPFWRNKSNHIQARARFLSPGTSPIFVTLSAVDMQ